MLNATAEQIRQAPDIATLYPRRRVFVRGDRVNLSNEAAYGEWASSAWEALITHKPSHLNPHRYQFFVVPQEISVYPLLRAAPIPLPTALAEASACFRVAPHHADR
ncbi:hypothetical protein ACIP1U_30530 [Cupriavidus sp. NPDC089707]|uniref:hypothetical protein n=1 Tax=Cupriavidus sp. NPDC089707 TaxID=3363963 RepID=UPI0037FB1E4B